MSKPQKQPVRHANTLQRPTRTYKALLNQIVDDLVTTKGFIPIHLERVVKMPEPELSSWGEELAIFFTETLPAMIGSAIVSVLCGFGLCISIATACILIAVLIVHGLPPALEIAARLWG